MDVVQIQLVDLMQAYLVHDLDLQILKSSVEMRGLGLLYQMYVNHLRQICLRCKVLRVTAIYCQSTICLYTPSRVIGR